MDRFDDIAREKLPCFKDTIDNRHQCPADYRDAVAQALRNADREGAKRARREAISEVRQRLIDLFWKPDGYFADWLLEQLGQGPLAAKEEETP